MWSSPSPTHPSLQVADVELQFNVQSEQFWRLQVPLPLQSSVHPPPGQSRLQVPLPAQFAVQLPPSHSKLQVPLEVQKKLQSAPSHFSVQVPDVEQAQVAPASHLLVMAVGSQPAQASSTIEMKAKTSARRRMNGSVWKIGLVSMGATIPATYDTATRGQRDSDLSRR